MARDSMKASFEVRFFRALGSCIIYSHVSLLLHSTVLSPARMVDKQPPQGTSFPLSLCLLLLSFAGHALEIQGHTLLENTKTLSTAAPSEYVDPKETITTKANKQIFIGYGAGWYENGLGSNYHSSYPYPPDPFLADSQYWPDYGWDHRHDFPYVWTGHKDVFDQERGGTIKDQKRRSENSRASEDIAGNERLLQEEAQREDVEPLEPSGQENQIDTHDHVGQASQKSNVSINNSQPFKVQGPKPDSHVNDIAAVTHSEGETFATGPVFVPEKDIKTKEEKTSDNLSAEGMFSKGVTGSSDDLFSIIDKQYYGGGGYPPSKLYFGDGFINAYWHKGRNGGGISLGGSLGEGGYGMRYDPYAWRGNGPYSGAYDGYGRGNYANGGYGGYGRYIDYGEYGGGHGVTGTGCCRRLRGSFHKIGEKD